MTVNSLYLYLNCIAFSFQMIGRIILNEKNLNLTKKIRLSLFSNPCLSAFKYSIYPALHKEDKSVSKHVRGPTPSLGKKGKFFF